MKYTCTKKYRNLPAAHRQPNHEGHCRLIHGHNWGFDITLSSPALDKNGFVYDFGKMTEIKKFLEETFDHTLLLNEDDPQWESIESLMESKDLAKVKILPSCSAEGLAEYVFKLCEQYFQAANATKKIQVVSVTCHEDDKNSATYYAK